MMGKKVIIITGTPAVGKSTLAKALVRKSKFQRLDLSRHYRQLATCYNRQKQCYEIDLEKLEKLVQEKLRESTKGLIVDSHIAHLLPRKSVDLCIVLTCSDLKKLQRRLQRRGYSRKKVQENLQAEIFRVCLEEAKGHKVIVFDTAKTPLPRILKQAAKSL